MGKQTKILRQIIDDFTKCVAIGCYSIKEIEQIKKQIESNFKKSLNKSDIIRRILNDVVLSNDEIVQLLRIIFNKQK